MASTAAALNLAPDLLSARPSREQRSAASVANVSEALFKLAPPPANANGRFAPSPTGRLHVGNLRTALVAWCCARSQGADFSLRIEDLDSERKRDGAAEQQLKDLAALGIDWDRPVVYQSERTSSYLAAIEVLRKHDLLYECWCTRAEIREAASAPSGTPVVYPGTCRDLPRAELQARRAISRTPALRVRAGDQVVRFFDRAHGDCTGVVDDFVVARQDGTAAYHLAVVIDDAELGVGEVVRGDDLLESTPAQVWLAEQLELAVPTYAHIPLMRDGAGKPLSKKDGSLTLAGQAANGLDPDRVRSDLAASLGLCELGEPIDIDQLALRFAATLVD